MQKRNYYAEKLPSYGSDLLCWRPVPYEALMMMYSTLLRIDMKSS